MIRRTTLLLLALLATACDAEDPPVERDLAAIRQQDTLTVLTTYNSTGYFLYRGRPMGYEYELLRDFAEEIGVVLEMEVVREREALWERLREGKGDLVAARLNPAAEQPEWVAFTRGLYRTQPTLVQRGLPDSATLRARSVANPAELAGKKVFVPENSAYLGRLLELDEAINGDIEVVEVDPDVSTETLIRSVAAGEINFTVAPANLAQLKESYFSNLVVEPSLGPPHPVAWAVRESSPELLQALNRFIAAQAEEGALDELYQTYFVDREGYRERVESEYLTSETGRLSEYDPLLKRAAQELGWDWRLLASQTYQESQFKPTAVSWAGATGLLQLMPATARQHGVTDLKDPEENVRGAVSFLQWLMEYWEEKIPDPAERLKFILASYNTGAGHVEDARRLTEKHGGNTTEWEDVAYWLLQKSKREVYTDPVVKYGFSRGLEPVEYVASILERFRHYRQFVTPEEAREAEQALEAGTGGR